MRPLETWHGSQERRPPTLVVAEARTRVCGAAAPSVSLLDQESWIKRVGSFVGSSECPRTDVGQRRMVIVRGHTGQGRKPTAWALQCSPGSGEMWQLVPTSTVVPPAQDGHLNQCILVRPHCLASSGWPALHSATKKWNVTLKCIYRRKFLLPS